MTTMKLELPTDNATVLFHMGEALRSIAVSEGYVAAVKPTVTETIGDITHTVTTEPLVTEEKVTPPTAVEQYAKSLADHDEVLSEIPEVSDDNPIDANGLPWDARIHSRGKTRLADDTWRNARKPADKDDDEWSAYVAEVEAELRALMEIPVATGEALDELAETPVITVEQRVELVTPPTLDEAAVADTISAEQAFTVPPVVTETPPVVTETPPTVKTFPELMKFITTNNGKLTKDSVNEVLSDNGLASITLLAARTDLIPQIHADLVKLL